MAKQAPKVAAKKQAGKVVAGKKIAAKKTVARKVAASKVVAKAPAKKAVAKKPLPRKAAPRKAAPRKAAPRKAAARKVRAGKPVPKSPGKVTRRPAKAPATEDAPVIDVVTLSATSEAHSVTTREPARNQLADDVERFLAKGGQIEEVPKNFRADPPRKPENNYGRGSI